MSKCPLVNPHEGRIASLDCRKCGAEPREACKRFDKPELRGEPIVCPRECPPYYDQGQKP